MATRGAARGMMGEVDQALADLNESIRLDPGYAPAFRNRARLYSRIGNRTRALADFASVIALSPRSSRDYYARASLYFDSRDYKRALADYEAAIRTNPDFALARNGRCLTRAILGEARDALDDCEQALKLDSADQRTLQDLAYTRSLATRRRLASARKAGSDWTALSLTSNP